MQDFHQLNVWRKAHTLVLRVYKASKDLPPSETMGLAAHLRRSAVTIPRTIAEGTGRASDFEFANDLKRSRAAAHELEYILLLCRDLGFIEEPLHDEMLQEVARSASHDLRTCHPAERNPRTATIGTHGLFI